MTSHGRPNVTASACLLLTADISWVQIAFLITWLFQQHLSVQLKTDLLSSDNPFDILVMNDKIVHILLCGN
ncbi:hypothetical protein RB213_001459 [Colletotrichum asianum]